MRRWRWPPRWRCGAAQAGQAQNYPNRPIKMILPFAAGGAGDTFARPLAQALSQSLGQPVVIENIVGAAAIIGTQVAARAPADGYTLLMVSNALAIGETMSPKRGYLLMREFTPITQLNALSLVLVANPKLPVQIRRRADRAGEVPARQAELRLVGRRLDLSPADGAPEIHGRDRHPACAVQVEQPGAHGRHRGRALA